MPRFILLIWFWSLVILPFTAIVTFITTLIVCNNVPHRQTSAKYPEISLLGTGRAYPYFAGGFIILVPQFLLVIIGRLLFLFQSQTVVNRIILCVIHVLAPVFCVFLLIMAVVSLDNNPPLHFTGAIGLFSSISSYCFLHTIVIFYLFARRSKAPRHSNILFPLWFLVCSIVMATCAGVWGATGKGIPQYIAAASPFLYLLGVVPQFWQQARAKNQDTLPPISMRYLNDLTF